jgi:hypothetical protein
LVRKISADRLENRLSMFLAVYPDSSWLLVYFQTRLWRFFNTTGKQLTSPERCF